MRRACANPVVGARLESKDLCAFSAVGPHDGVMVSLVPTWVYAETMSMFLVDVAHRRGAEFVVMVTGQTGWHVAGELLEPQKMCLILLRPCSPELNPAEHLWELLREDRFAKHVFANLDAVEMALTRGPVTLEADPT